ncbi:hypothetical protein [Halobacillus salinus]|uniref:Uncharacterized protein n=1 Tax=Halobacillus salinus TaxID=192814 RepID=A0A4Z0H024_9BACI|nr:hypothetical protein [Halobacillus salinus]TGB03812.1 hypothetical protein E4663_02040 [Halobacillus salinus]
MDFPSTVTGKISVVLLGIYLLLFLVSLFFLSGGGILIIFGVSIVAGWFLVVPSLIVSVVATVKETGAKKTLPVVNIFVTLLVFGVAMFAQYGFQFAP